MFLYKERDHGDICPWYDGSYEELVSDHKTTPLYKNHIRLLATEVQKS